MYFLASEKILELGAGTAIAAIMCAKKGARVTVQEVADIMPHTVKCFEINGINPANTVTSLWGAECVQQATGCEKFTDLSSDKNTTIHANANIGEGSEVSLCEVDCLNSNILVEEGTVDTDHKSVKRKRKKTFGGMKSSDRISDKNRSGFVSDGWLKVKDGELFDRIVMADVLYHSVDFSSLLRTVMGCISDKGALVVCHEQRRRNLDEFFETLTSLFHSCEKHTIEIEHIPEANNRENYCDEYSAKITVFHLHIFRAKIL